MRHITKKKNIVAGERRAQALALRKQGMTLRDIGARLGVSGVAIHGYLKAELDALRAECHEEARLARDIELCRLDELHGVAWAIAFDPNETPEVRLKGVDRVLRTMERRAKLLGLDAPDRALVADVTPREPMTLERLAEVRRLVYGRDE